MVRRKVFETTNHSEMRMRQRNMPPPWKLGLIIANRKTKKKIKESCPNEGFKSECIY